MKARGDIETVPVSGVWLRCRGDNVMEVLVEVDGDRWLRVIKEPVVEDGVTSHIVEVGGILGSPEDEVTK